MQDDLATLLDILNAAKRAQSFLGTADRNSFDDDLKTQSSVLHQILILGEAVKRLSVQFRNSHPDMPWREYAGMRDVLIHAYDSVDLDEVWKTMKTDVPKLIAYVQPLVPNTDAP